MKSQFCKGYDHDQEMDEDSQSVQSQQQEQSHRSNLSRQSRQNTQTNCSGSGQLPTFTPQTNDQPHNKIQESSKNQPQYDQLFIPQDQQLQDQSQQQNFVAKKQTQLGCKEGSVDGNGNGVKVDSPNKKVLREINQVKRNSTQTQIYAQNWVSANTMQADPPANRSSGKKSSPTDEPDTLKPIIVQPQELPQLPTVHDLNPGQQAGFMTSEFGESSRKEKKDGSDKPMNEMQRVRWMMERRQQMADKKQEKHIGGVSGFSRGATAVHRPSKSPVITGSAFKGNMGHAGPEEKESQKSELRGAEDMTKEVKKRKDKKKRKRKNQEGLGQEAKNKKEKKKKEKEKNDKKIFKFSTLNDESDEEKTSPQQQDAVQNLNIGQSRSRVAPLFNHRQTCQEKIQARGKSAFSKSKFNGRHCSSKSVSSSYHSSFCGQSSPGRDDLNEQVNKIIGAGSEDEGGASPLGGKTLNLSEHIHQIQNFDSQTRHAPSFFQMRLPTFGQVGKIYSQESEDVFINATNTNIFKKQQEDRLLVDKDFKFSPRLRTPNHVDTMDVELESQGSDFLKYEAVINLSDRSNSSMNNSQAVNSELPQESQESFNSFRSGNSYDPIDQQRGGKNATALSSHGPTHKVIQNQKSKITQTFLLIQNQKNNRQLNAKTRRRKTLAATQQRIQPKKSSFSKFADPSLQNDPEYIQNENTNEQDRKMQNFDRFAGNIDQSDEDYDDDYRSRQSTVSRHGGPKIGMIDLPFKDDDTQFGPFDGRKGRSGIFGTKKQSNYTILSDEGRQRSPSDREMRVNDEDDISYNSDEVQTIDFDESETHIKQYGIKDLGILTIINRNNQLQQLSSSALVTAPLSQNHANMGYNCLDSSTDTLIAGHMTTPELVTNKEQTIRVKFNEGPIDNRRNSRTHFGSKNNQCVANIPNSSDGKHKTMSQKSFLSPRAARTQNLFQGCPGSQRGSGPTTSCRGSIIMDHNDNYRCNYSNLRNSHNLRLGGTLFSKKSLVQTKSQLIKMNRGNDNNSSDSNDRESIENTDSGPSIYMSNLQQFETNHIMQDNRLSAKISQKVIEDSQNNLTDTTPTNTNLTHPSETNLDADKGSNTIDLQIKSRSKDQQNQINENSYSSNMKNQHEKQQLYLANKQLIQQNFINERQISDKKFQSEGGFTGRLMKYQNRSLDASDNFKSSECNVESSCSLAVQQKNIQNIQHINPPGPIMPPPSISNYNEFKIPIRYQSHGQFLTPKSINPHSCKWINQLSDEDSSQNQSKSVHSYSPRDSLTGNVVNQIYSGTENLIQTNYPNQTIFDEIGSQQNQKTVNVGKSTFQQQYGQDQRNKSSSRRLSLRGKDSGVFQSASKQDDKNSRFKQFQDESDYNSEEISGSSRSSSSDGPDDSSNDSCLSGSISSGIMNARMRGYSMSDAEDCSSDAQSSDDQEKQIYIKQLYAQIEKDKLKELQKKAKLNQQTNQNQDKSMSVLTQNQPTDPITQPKSPCRPSSASLHPLILDDSIEPFVSLIENDKDTHDLFLKQFGDIIGKMLKKKLQVVQDLESIQMKYQKSGQNKNKKTLVLALDDCILKTSIFKDEFPRIDGHFMFQKLKIYVCFRKFLKEFLMEAQKYFEIILWSSSQADYTDSLLKILESQLDFKFDHCLSMADMTPSEEKEYYCKNIEILIGRGGRLVSEIIIVDSWMQNYTNRLTNGLFLPSYRLHQDGNDMVLQSLLKYIMEFVNPLNPIEDFRNKIKLDFGLLEKFNGFKQTVAFNKIKKTLEEAMETNSSDQKDEESTQFKNTE